MRSSCVAEAAPALTWATPLVLVREHMGLFDLLDNFVIWEILRMLPPAALCAMSCTCREFAYAIEDEEIWKRYSRKAFMGNLPFRGTWKRSVIEMHRPYRVVPKAQPVPVVGCFLRQSKKRMNHWRYCHFDLTKMVLPQSQIPRRSAKTMTVEEFYELFDKPQLPCLITDAMDGWQASSWTYDGLAQLLGNRLVRGGAGFRMTIANYLTYMRNQTEQSPLYLFDGKLDVRAPELVGQFGPPKYFTPDQDCFSKLDPDDRPPYRWIIIGPRLTGAAWHVDPYLTPAWNAVIRGRKRWSIYPPGVLPIGTGDPNSDFYEAPRPIKWFERFYDALPPSARPVEFMHEEGEILFLPAAWQHQVLNITDTIAVTQNFVTRGAFPTVYRDTKKDDEFHDQFRTQVVNKDPELRAIADQIDADMADKRARRSSSSSTDSSSSSSSSSSGSSD